MNTKKICCEITELDKKWNQYLRKEKVSLEKKSLTKLNNQHSLNFTRLKELAIQWANLENRERENVIYTVHSQFINEHLNFVNEIVANVLLIIRVGEFNPLTSEIIDNKTNEKFC